MNNICNHYCIDCGDDIPVEMPKHIGTEEGGEVYSGSVTKCMEFQKQYRKRCNKCAHTVMLKKKNGE